MPEIPLSEASMSEVLARVAYELIKRRARLLGCAFFYQNEVLSVLARQLARYGYSALSFWVCAYAARLREGEEPIFTRTAFIMRARLGMDFRSVAYFDYKGTRRRDPRVTNRGVAAKATKGGR